MCATCEQDLAAMTAAEKEHDAEGVARIASYIVAESIPNTMHGLVVAAAVGSAVAKIVADVSALEAGESMTPRMREIAEQLAARAAEKVVEAYRGTPEPLLVVPL